MEKENPRTYDASAIINGASSANGRGVSVYGASENTASAPAPESSFSMMSNLVQPEVKEPEPIDLQKAVTEEEEKLTTGIVKGFEAGKNMTVFEPSYVVPSRRTATITADKMREIINSAFSGIFSDYIDCEVRFLGNPTESFSSLRAMRSEIEKDLFKDGLFDCRLVFSPNLKTAEEGKFHNLIEVTSDDGAATKITSPLAKQVAGINAIMASGNILKINQATKVVLDPFVSDIFRENNGKIGWEKLEANPNNGVIGQRNNPLGVVNPNNGEMRNVTIQYTVKVSLSKVINALISLNEKEEYSFENIPAGATDKEKEKIYTENSKKFLARIRNNKISINIGNYFTTPPAPDGSTTTDPNSFTIILEEIDRKEIEATSMEIERYKFMKTNTGRVVLNNPAYRGYPF